MSWQRFIMGFRLLLLGLFIAVGCSEKNENNCSETSLQIGKAVFYVGPTGVSNFLLSQTYTGTVTALPTSALATIQWSHLTKAIDTETKSLVMESNCHESEKNKRVEYFGAQGPGDVDFPSRTQKYVGKITRHFGSTFIEVDWDHLKYHTVEKRSDLEIK